MEYLIIIYKERIGHEIPEIEKIFILHEEEMYDYVNEHHDNVKFTVSKIETILDFS